MFEMIAKLHPVINSTQSVFATENHPKKDVYRSKIVFSAAFCVIAKM